MRGDLSKETQARVAAHAEVTRKLSNVAVDDNYLDIFGLWWLVIATVATSIPEGVAWVLHVVFS